MILTRLSLLGIIVPLWFGVACSSNSSPSAPPADKGAADGGTPMFRVLVLEDGPDGAVVVAKNAAVSLVAPGEEVPLEVSSDDTGIATFPAIDWSLGTASLTTFGEGRVMVIDGFMEPPAIKVSSQPLYQPWTISNVPAGAKIQLAVTDAKNILWTVSAPPGVASATPPKLPAAASRLLPTGVLKGTVSLLGDYSPQRGYLKVAQSRVFGVAR